MFRSIQWKIAIPFIVLIAGSMGILGIYLTNFARNSQLDNFRSLLEKEARTIAEASIPIFPGQGSPDKSGDVLAKKLGKEIMPGSLL